MKLELYQATIAISVLLVIAEMITGTFLLLGLAIGVGPLVPIHVHTGEVHWGRNLIIVATLSGLIFFMLRRIFKKPADSEYSSRDINTY